MLILFLKTVVTTNSLISNRSKMFLIVYYSRSGEVANDFFTGLGILLLEHHSKILVMCNNIDNLIKYRYYNKF